MPLHHLHRPAPGNNPTIKKRLNDLLQQSDNQVCADCSAPNPKWASANIGVFICLKCCDVHRSLGSSTSKVQSVTLDEWSDDEIDAMVEVGGNGFANSIYEAHFPEGVSKPGPEASHDEREKYIRSKYVLQEFLEPSLRITSGESKKSSLKANVTKKIKDSVHHTSSSSKKKEGMVDSAAMLKIIVINATDLPIRDMLTSDPYVVLTLGEQKVQTTVAKRNLNPVWNEEFTLSVPENDRAIKLAVFDYDALSSDDSMGEAEIDIQPILKSAKAIEDPRLFGNMQIGKWPKSDNNALIEDSAVNIVDGKIKQKVSIQLQNVESGELYLELEWISPDQ